MNTSRASLHLVFCCLILLSGCGPESQAESKASPPAAPAQVTGAVKETELATIRLTPEAESRLGIEVTPAENRRLATYRTLSGEVTLPPGQGQSVIVPVAGTLAAVGDVPQVGTSVQRSQPLYRLVPLERESRGLDLRAQADKELQLAQARIEAAQSRSQRAEQLLRDGAGSQRNLEEARLELAQAEAAEKGAREQLTYLSKTPFDSAQGMTIEAPESGMVVKIHVSAGQVVPAGTTMMDIARVDPVWIRVPVYVGEMRELSASRSVMVHAIGQTPGSGGRTAHRVTGVPSANAAAATADLFYEIENSPLMFRPGEKVGVSFGREQSEALAIPWSAVIHDINGGTWIYENPSPQTYNRRRVEILYVRDGFAAVGRGVSAGTNVVKTGAAELFGTEFGVGK
jgi:RND family efflux transporter MFP subunit